MSTPFQNRLVGTIIVSAAAIIFLPDILDGEKHSEQTRFEAIPAAPAFHGDKAVKEFPTAQLQRLPQQQLSDERAIDEDVTDEASVPQQQSAAQTAQDDSTRVTVAEKPVDFDALPAETAKVTEPGSDVNVQDNRDDAWVIQLGSFKHKKNVDELLQKLKSHGYVAFTRPIQTHSGELTKVFVGPELSKQALEGKIADLQQLTKMQGKVARFVPTK